MDSEITFSVTDHDQVKVVKLSGNISNVSKTDVEVMITELTQKNNVILDMKKVNVITSGGIAALINISSEARKRKKRVLITGLRDHFKRMIEVMGLIQYVIIVESIEDGVSMLQK
ncbi:MAG: STAS domain-containing protein [Spirochaetes bacterium]|nr:STAS domain-containing protein [Spirochaetota bacterium]